MSAWILVGMMGAGKSSVGRKLCDLTGRPFLDTDLMIQDRFARTTAQIFRIYGEEAFRDHETSVLQGLGPQPVVLATGGGIVERPENWVELHRLGTTIYLDCSEETIIRRLEESKKRRPLLETDDWRQTVRDVLARRAPLYRQADLHISLDKIAIEDAAAAVLECLGTLTV